jgi:ADP-ribosylglycohydrolase
LEGGFDMGGWLIQSSALWASRTPGNTCLSALRNMKRIGEPATNNSKGCGGVMRVAPVGLVASRERAFEMGCETAALTHGHPSGYLSAGFLASLIAEIVAGMPLQDAIRTAKGYLKQDPDHEEVLEAVEKAERLASAKAPNAVAAGALGAGWVAEEALAVALNSALVSPNLEEAVVLAVNHSGDSDSTGAIAGNICGTLYGGDSIPARWLDPLELRDEISAMADDLAELHEGKLEEVTDYLWKRYPGG